MNELTERARSAFEDRFGGAPTVTVRAPGRVNLIGEHTDYNEGWVLPMAIDLEVQIAARPRAGGRVRLVALDEHRAESEFDLADIRPDAIQPWSNYVRGVAAELRARGYRFPGAEAVITGNVPLGAGLSSSAALQVAAATLFKALGGFALDKVRLAQLCQAAEHAFCGVQSGIMDQFASALSKARHALLVDCRDLSYANIPLPPEAQIVVGDTRKSRELAGSAYNTRRAECGEALRYLARVLERPLAALRDVTPEEFARAEGQLPPTLRRRARHVVLEDARVLEAVDAARQNDLETLGRLMNESHESLKSDYEVSSFELDAMVEAARRQPGVFGSRLTGAGFGGCTVTLVGRAAAEQAAAAIASEYAARTGLEPRMYLLSPQDGAGLAG